MLPFSDILLTVDFDRTLTAPDSSIPERNLKAIRFFIENGGVFTINTGRSVPMAACNIIGKVPVNAPLLLYNGSAAYDIQTGELSQCRILPVDPEAFVAELVSRFPMMHVELQGVDAHYLFVPDAGWVRYTEHNRCAWGYADPNAVPRPFLKIALNGQFRDATIASMYDATPEELQLFDEAVNWLKEHYGDRLDIYRACPRIIDIHAKGCSKLASARTLQEQLGRSILVCVGDADNDLMMLQGADYAFCPADGLIADRFPNVCACGEGAVADVIYKKLPEILGICLDNPESIC